MQQMLDGSSGYWRCAVQRCAVQCGAVRCGAVRCGDLERPKIAYSFLFMFSDLTRACWYYDATPATPFCAFFPLDFTLVDGNT
jgi:hypothetical protein